MRKESEFRGDFGWAKQPVAKDQVVGIFDLVAFSARESNDDLVAAVAAMEMRIRLALGKDYFWGERTLGGWESDRNEVLLRSTGDGYVVAFSQDDNDFDVLETLLNIYTGVSKNHKVNLGINKGQNYVVADVNGLVNIIGWGVNYSARALQFAKNGQIICTEFFAKPVLKAYGDKITKKHMVNLGTQKIKETKMELFNYYRRGEFGAPLTKDQLKER